MSRSALCHSSPLSNRSHRSYLGRQGYRRLVVVTATMLTALLSSQAQAGDGDGDGEGEANAEASASLDDEGTVFLGKGDESTDADKEHQKRKDIKWIKRWAPEPMTYEVGLYGGIFIPNANHELYGADPDLGPEQGWKPYRSINPDFGLRFGFYPIRHFGIEAEGGAMLMGVEGADGTGLGYAVRAHVVGQVGLWSVTPFVLFGAGALGIASDRALLGNDIDPAMHFGGGVKAHLNRYISLRLDGRGLLSYAQGTAAFFESMNMEVLLSVTGTFGRKKRKAAVAKPVPKPKPGDRDGDGIMDPDDECPDEFGVPELDGCPIPDSDGDGILDPDDKCPEVPGVEEYQGCPIPDSDGDGILDPDDKCVEEPENKNGYEDDDGCPDEIPEAVKAFTGVIEGIYFDTNKDTIKSKSEEVLNKALKVLKDFPEVKLNIEGHTDSRGNYEHNMDLSRRRAESVKKWMVDHGIDAARFGTAGFGPDQPIDSNKTKAGRAKNRRIEFKLKTD